MTLRPDVLCGLVAMVGFGLSTITAQPATKVMGEARTVMWRNILMTAIIAAILPWMIEFSRITAGSLVTAILIASCGYIPLYYFYKGLRVGKAGVVAPIANASSLISAGIGIYILGEKVGYWGIIAIIITAMGVIVTTVDPKKWRRSELLTLKSGAPYALVALIGWGFFYPIIQVPVKQMGAWPVVFITELTIAIVAIGQVLRQEKVYLPTRTRNQMTLRTLVYWRQWRLFWRAVKNNMFGHHRRRHWRKLKQAFRVPRGKMRWFLLGQAVFGAIAAVAFNLGLELGYVSVVDPIASASPVIVVIGAYLFFRERLERRQYVGGVIAVIGVIWLAISTS